MNYWAKLSAGIGVLGLLIGVWYADEYYTEKEKKDKEVAGKALSFEEAKVRQIELINNGQPFRFERTAADGKWQMAAPNPAIAPDQDAVNNLVAAAGDIRKEQLLEEKDGEDLAPFGLTEPRRRIKVDLEGDTSMELLIGGDVQIGKAQGSGFKALSVYAKISGEKGILVVPSTVLTSTDRTFADFRTKQVVSFTRDDVSRFSFNKDGAVWTLEKKDGTWTMTGSDATVHPGDSNNVGLYLDRIQRLRADSVVEQDSTDNGNSLASLGLEPPNASIVFQNDKGEDLHMMKVGVTKTHTNVTMSDGGIAQLSLSEFTELVPNVQTLRDLKVMRGVEMDKITRLITENGKTYQREGQKWYPVASPTADAGQPQASEEPSADRTSKAEVATLFSDFEFMRADSIIDPSQTRPDATYGLDRPFKTFTFEFAADSGMQSIQVRVGNRVENDEKKIYMKRDGSDAVYIIETTWMDALQAIEADEKQKPTAEENTEVSPQAKKED